MIGKWFSDFFGSWFGSVDISPPQETTLLYNPTIEIVSDYYSIEEVVELTISLETELLTIEQSGLT